MRQTALLRPMRKPIISLPYTARFALHLLLLDRPQVFAALIRDRKAVMSNHTPQVTALTTFHLEGYISARILVEGIKRSGSSPTAERLAAALRDMGPQDLGGFTVDFSKSNSGSNFIDLAVIDSSGKLRY
jgi:branched-chain amino acid transport system substrate-binding protein